jgi:hypothetical protein
MRITSLKGRGGLTVSRLTLEAVRQIPATLFAADDWAAEGPIYIQVSLDLDGTEPVGNWPKPLTMPKISLSREFIAQYPFILASVVDQPGDAS